MDLVDKIRRYENLHIVFWLVKDTCWMLEIKWLGVLMVLPTMAVAIYIVARTFRTSEVYISFAILFWITANSYWMVVEFFNDNQLKNLAAIPFGLGFVFVAIFYYKSARNVTGRDIS